MERRELSCWRRREWSFKGKVGGRWVESGKIYLGSAEGQGNNRLSLTENGQGVTEEVPFCSFPPQSILFEKSRSGKSRLNDMRW